MGNRYCTLNLVRIGTRQFFNQVKHRVMKMPYSDRGHFLGSRIDARRILCLANVYAHPSRGEGFGLAVVEAMLVGMSFVVSDEGALPEVVCEGEAGRVFKGGDEKQLGVALL